MVSSSPARLEPAVTAPPRTQVRTGWLIAAAIAFVYLFTTGTLPFLGRDEPRYVEVAREMWRSGDWITPTLGGAPWFEKPALLYWMVAANFSIFGASEWAARLAPAFCGLATIWAVFWVTRFAGLRTSRWAALGLASSGGILAFSFCATFDIVLTACVTLALCAFYASLETPRREHVRPLLALFWVGVGLAFMAKGLVAFILTLGAVGLYALIRGERARLGWLWGLPLALAVSASWYAPVIIRDGWPFIQEFFVEHHFQRYLSDKYKHSQPPYFYLEILPLLALPWTPFLLGALWKLRISHLREDSPSARLQALGLAWMLVPVLFFSVSGSKLPGYILPALPGAFLFMAPILSGWASTRGRQVLCGAMVAGMLFVRPWFFVFGPHLHILEENAVRQIFVADHASAYAALPVIQYRVTQRTAQYYEADQLVYDRGEKDVLELRTPGQVATRIGTHPALILVKTRRAGDLLNSPLLKTKMVVSRGDFDLLEVERP